jgi:hypothetical protein
MPNNPEARPPSAAAPRRPTLASRASALLVTLLLLTIVTTIVVLMFQAVTIDRRLAADFQKGVQARAISQFALDDALQTLQSALNNLDDPFGATTAATNFWAVAPGRIDLFSLASGSSRPQRTATIPLHSGYDTSKELVDLNFTNASGSRAIWPGGLDMPVNWKPVLKNPSSAASATNPIVGRYAFWVDDESSKVNINTADGTELYTTNSYGVGTPSSVRLRAILSTLGTNDIKAISAEAISNQFSDLSEVGRLNTNYLAAVRSNAFFLTEYSRSPEFNIFNEPRFQLASMWGGNRASNGITGTGTVGTPTNFIPASPHNRLPLDFRLSAYSNTTTLDAQNFPARSIYPTPLQLTNTNRSSFWPYLPALNCDTPASSEPGRKSGSLASLAQITNAVGATNNYALRSYNSQERFAAARRLALYLVGTNANMQPITWPFADANYSTTKYALSQIDSIIVQALDRVNLAVYNQTHFAAPPLLAPYGILGTNPVIGQGNFPKLCEMLFEFNWGRKRSNIPVITGNSTNWITVDPDGSRLTAKLWQKGFVPAHYLNPVAISTNTLVPMSGTTINGLRKNYGPLLQSFDVVPWNYTVDRTNFSFSTNNFPSNTLNGYPGGASYYASPWVTDSAISTNITNPYMSYWGDNLLQAVDQNGLCAGIDFHLHPSQLTDPDPRKAIFRREGKGSFTPPSGNTNWGGSVWAQGGNDGGYSLPAGTLDFGSAVTFQQPGSYSVVKNYGHQWALPSRDFYSTNFIGGVPQPLISSGPAASTAYTNKVTSFTLRGGINYRVNRNALEGILEIVPLTSLQGPAGWSTNCMFSTAMPDTNAVIPFPSGVTVSSTTPTMYVWASVADPLVNKFPGDWTVTASTNIPAHTMGTLGNSWDPGLGWYYPLNTPNASSTDMAATWGPISTILRSISSVPNKMTLSANTITNTICPTLNLPSVGSLQYIRTKMIPPDDAGNTNRGQPFRCLSFAGASDATQSGIPDWAMLDLMTVPQAIYDKPGNIMLSGASNVINLTYGGATTGKLNPNGSALFPWVTNSATYIRPQPLTAVFTDLRYNLDGSTNFTPLATNLASTLASNVATYIAANGPLSMAGQICDIPAINAYGAATVNPTRNDIVSQSIGLLETRSSVFSVWVAAQSIAKRPANTGYGGFEPGDSVQSEKRYRFTVERFLDLGVDGVPGNANSPGPDNVVGTLDDTVDAVYNPPNPKYKYRIINAQEIL